MDSYIAEIERTNARNDTESSFFGEKGKTVRKYRFLENSLKKELKINIEIHLKQLFIVF